MVDACMFSSKKTTWGTPLPFFRRVHRHFKFTVDAAANAKNTKLPRWWGPRSREHEDSLSISWEGERVWLNPPYGRGLTGKWVKKAYEESQKKNTLVVCLLPARPDTVWWHLCVMKAHTVYFIKGRLTFIGALDPATFPSCLVVFKRSRRTSPVFKTLTQPSRRKKKAA